MSNRDIQMVVCDGNPGHPLWNKVPTRCRTLETLGLVEQVTDAGTPVLRSHSSWWKVSRMASRVTHPMDECPSCGSMDIIVVSVNSSGWVIDCSACHYGWVETDRVFDMRFAR